MGLFFSNLHVRRTEGFSAERFQSVLAEILKKQGFLPANDPGDAGLSVSVCDDGGKWVSVCTDGIDFYTEESTRGICDPLSDEMGADVLTISCFDSDCLLLNLINRRQGTDAWAKVGRYPEIQQRTTPARWKGLIEDVSSLNAVLNAKYTFAEDALEALEPLLGLAHGQGSFCGEQASSNGCAGSIRRFYYSLPENSLRPEPPRMTMPIIEGMPCKMHEASFLSVVNAGGKSTGLAVAFSGSYVEREEIRFCDVQLEYGLDRFPRIVVPLQLEKRQVQDGRWIYYAEAPQIPIPPGVPEGLPPRKARDTEHKRSIGLRFRPEGNARKRLDITVHFIPLKNPEGQCAWYVWMNCRSKRAFMEEYNRMWSWLPTRDVELLNADELDLDE